MASSTEPRSGIKYGWALGENNWKNEMDANLLSVGRFAYHLSVKDRDLATPPGAPASGDTYIVAASPTGAWVGKTGQIAVWGGAAWVFGVPRTGWRAWIEDESVLAVYSSSAWAVGQLPADFSGLADAGTLDGAELVPVNKTGAKRTTVQKILDWIMTQAITWTAKQTISGNLEFSGNARRILGDFSNTTYANRVAFQSSSVNANTGVFLIPNGTATTANITASNASDPTNSAIAQVACTSTEALLVSGKLGTGTLLPLVFNVGGVNFGRITTTGRWEHDSFTKLGESSPAIKVKKLTGTTGGGIDTATPVAHGLDASKIISVTGYVTNNSSQRLAMPFMRDSAAQEVDLYFDATNVVVVTGPASISNVWTRPFTVFIVYEE